ncbi:UNVERIFIED_CONTAM: hypothetical protein PYX00_008892 [Menopon gallinae]|uniref:Uncharacterized protein n=1 Tax=Menopon gallinae TaxID=328185 RepID=A0AAW2H9E0_9NEOP
MGTVLCYFAVLALFSVASGTDEMSKHWDYLVFSQKWPVTFCIQQGGPESECLFPKNALDWTIHGVWPTRLDGLGPFYCNTTVKFDVEKVTPIRRKLEEYWPNLEVGKTVESLWQHEWEKHGTCVLDFEPLNTEEKYFQGGLNLYGKYNITWLLEKVKIFPDRRKEYNVQYMTDQIRKVLSKNPDIHCIKRSSNKKFYLFEIRLCLDKELDLIDCDPRFNQNTKYSSSNCPLDVSIMYPKDAEGLHGN